MRVTRRIGLTAIGLSLGLGAATVRAAVVAVVAAKSPVITLSKSQIIDIFLGKRTRFPDGSVAVPIDQVAGVAARNEFYARCADMSPAQIKAFWSKVIFTGRGQPPKAVASSAEAKRLVAANLDAVAYIDQTLVDGSVRVVLTP